MRTMLERPQESGYRLGFASLDHEVSLDALPIEGVLPPWLTGTLLRNGPARFSVGSDQYRHWFDGLAMVHRFTVGGGAVSYANRFLRTPAFCDAERTGHIAQPEFATVPQRSLIERLGAVFGTAGASHNANVNIVPFADGYLALTETPSPVAFDGDTLETLGVRSYDDKLTGQITTAHTHHDPARHATFNILIDLGRKSSYSIVRIEDGTFARTVIASIAIDEPAYVHAFSTTGRYVVIVEYPLVVRPLDLLLQRKPYIDNYQWKPQRGTRFHVIDKDTGARAGSYEAEPFFAFHHANAFDDGDTVVLDICAYEDAAIVGQFMLNRLRAGGGNAISRAAFRRYRLVPGKTAAQIETIPGAFADLPRVAPANAAKPYRYAYGVDYPAGGSELFNLVKIDVLSGSVIAWSAPNANAGEPVFVPRPDAVDEDDGVVLSVVLDSDARRSYLLVLDARTFAEHGRAYVPHHIPFGFHGMFAKG